MVSAFAAKLSFLTLELAMRTSPHQPAALQALNTLMFAGIMMWFVAQQNLFIPLTVKYGPTDVTKATHYQPSTPPPLLDPEQMSSSGEEFETFWDYWPHH